MAPKAMKGGAVEEEVEVASVTDVGVEEEVEVDLFDAPEGLSWVITIAPGTLSANGIVPVGTVFLCPDEKFSARWMRKAARQEVEYARTGVK